MGMRQFDVHEVEGDSNPGSKPRDREITESKRNGTTMTLLNTSFTHRRSKRFAIIDTALKAAGFRLGWAFSRAEPHFQSVQYFPNRQHRPRNRPDPHSDPH